MQGKLYLCEYNEMGYYVLYTFNYIMCYIVFHWEIQIKTF